MWRCHCLHRLTPQIAHSDAVVVKDFQLSEPELQRKPVHTLLTATDREKTGRVSTRDKNDGFRSPDDLPHCVTELIPEFSSSDCCRAWACPFWMSSTQWGKVETVGDEGAVSGYTCGAWATACALLWACGGLCKGTQISASRRGACVLICIYATDPKKLVTCPAQADARAHGAAVAGALSLRRRACNKSPVL